MSETIKVKHPKGYLDKDRAYLDHLNDVDNAELPFEFMMNQLRLHQTFSLSRYESTTGLSANAIRKTLAQAQQKQLMSCQEVNGEEFWQVTKLGQRYLNDLLELFL